MHLNRVVRVSQLLLFFIALTASLFAQTNRGGISGTVMDQSGAVVPNARKITDSPALNASELSITARRAPALEPSFKLSMLTPDISEM